MKASELEELGPLIRVHPHEQIAATYALELVEVVALPNLTLDRFNGSAFMVAGCGGCTGCVVDRLDPEHTLVAGRLDAKLAGDVFEQIVARSVRIPTLDVEKFLWEAGREQADI